MTTYRRSWVFPLCEVFKCTVWLWTPCRIWELDSPAAVHARPDVQECFHFGWTITNGKLDEIGTHIPPPRLPSRHCSQLQCFCADTFLESRVRLCFFMEQRPDQVECITWNWLPILPPWTSLFPHFCCPVKRGRHLRFTCGFVWLRPWERQPEGVGSPSSQSWAGRRGGVGRGEERVLSTNRLRGICSLNAHSHPRVRIQVYVTPSCFTYYEALSALPGKRLSPSSPKDRCCRGANLTTTKYVSSSGWLFLRNRNLSEVLHSPPLHWLQE